MAFQHAPLVTRQGFGIEGRGLCPGGDGLLLGDLHLGVWIQRDWTLDSAPSRYPTWDTTVYRQQAVCFCITNVQL